MENKSINKGTLAEAVLGSGKHSPEPDIPRICQVSGRSGWLWHGWDGSFNYCNLVPSSLESGARTQPCSHGLRFHMVAIALVSLCDSLSKSLDLDLLFFSNWAPILSVNKWMLWWAFLVVSLTLSGMSYSPEVEGTPVIWTLRLKDTGFWSGSWEGITNAFSRGPQLLLEVCVRTVGRKGVSVLRLPALVSSARPVLYWHGSCLLQDSSIYRRSSETPSLMDWTITRFSDFPFTTSLCWISWNAACKSLQYICSFHICEYIYVNIWSEYIWNEYIYI